jgi:DNA-binding transcriptional LysR family regulator
MNVNQLWVFYNVARHRSFSRAAEALFVTQPSVSNQVKLFEESCGLQLFERNGKKVELTGSGEILFSYAARIFSLIEETEIVIQDIKGTKSGRIRIASGNTPSTYYLPAILDLFRKKHPQIGIQLDVGYDLDIVESILKAKSDLGLIGRKSPHPKLVAIPLWKEELVLIVPPAHAFARHRAVQIPMLQDQPLIMAEKGSGVREIVEGILSAKEISPRIVMELGGNEAIKHAVVSGLGISIIPLIVAKREVEAGALRAVRFSEDRIMRQFFAIHHKDKNLSSLIKSFLDELLHFPGCDVSLLDPEE